MRWVWGSKQFARSDAPVPAMPTCFDRHTEASGVSARRAAKRTRQNGIRLPGLLQNRRPAKRTVNLPRSAMQQVVVNMQVQIRAII